MRLPVHPVNYQIPETATWSLRIERQIGKDWVASVAYVGNKGTFLPDLIEGNPAVAFPGASTVANTQNPRLYPTVGRAKYADPATSRRLRSG